MVTASTVSIANRSPQKVYTKLPIYIIYQMEYETPLDWGWHDCSAVRRLSHTHNTVLVGTGHSSTASQRLVTRVIRDTRPDVIALELDRTRFRKLIRNRSGTGRTATCPIDRELQQRHRIAQLSSHREPATVQIEQFERDADDDLHSGSPTAAAVTLAGRLDASIGLIDRPLVQSFERCDEQLSRTEFRLYQLHHRLADLTGRGKSTITVSSDGEISIDTPLWARALHTLSHRTYTRIMIAERDAWMAERLRWLADRYDSVVGVVGYKHLDGIEADFAAQEGAPATPPIFTAA